MSLLAVTSGSSGSSLVTPEGIDFDGVTDYLSRNTCLSGGVATKTFTFSCFVYNATSSETRVVAEFLGDLGAGYNIFRVIVAENNIQLIGYNQSISIILNCSVSTGNAPKNSWYNFICSVDLSNSSKRHMYINDVSKGVFDTFTNDSIAFNKPSLIYIGKPVPNNGNLNFKGRLSNVFLDYTYRDLSIEANRRLFITADGKPTPTATLKALNPILYLPMKDSATAHINEGTGGNFTLNGTIATSNRGANQDNCVASKFDGVNDYLSRTSLTGIADGKVFTFSCNFNTYNTVGRLLTFWTSTTSIQPKLYIQVTTVVSISAQNAAGTTVLIATLPIIQNKNYNLSISLDLSNSSLRKMIVNGVDVTSSVSWTKYLDDLMDLAFTVNTPVYSIGYYNTTYHLGNIGELYFDTRYTDLSTSNPFWDTNTNRPKPVRQVIRETGITPLIAMPIDASNAGKNYGTGGDFIANSAPYVGARGASEYISRSAYSNVTTNTFRSTYLHNANISAPSIYTTFSLFICANNTVATPVSDTILFRVGGLRNLVVFFDTSSDLTVNFGGISTDRKLATDLFLSTNIFRYMFIFYDGTTLRAYTDLGLVEIVVAATMNNTDTACSILGSSIDVAGVAYDWKGHVSSPYFTTDYIDFSQEVNRLKFIDGLGYPKDLKAQIDAGVIPTPLIYLPFDDPSNLGKNLGTGGDFTVNGTVTQGSDFSI